MAFGRANDLKKAEKLVQQGKIAAAIKEYSNLVAANPSDLTLVNTLGDLCVREGRIEEAIASFTRIGENYSRNGFTLKAIAMYKKIYKLAPSNPEVAYTLAELYSKQGLIVDARKQYMEVADAFTRSGRTQQALDVLRKIADLDPDNVSVRLKLAESYQRERMNDQAVEAYSAAGQQLNRKRNFDEAEQAFSRALAIAPTNKAALSGLAGIYVERGDTYRAVDLLNGAAAQSPNDPDLMVLMGRTYLGAGLLDDAERAFLALIQVDKSRFEYLLQVGRKFADLGQCDRAVTTVEACLETVITQRQEARAVEILGTVTELDPYNIRAFVCLRDIYTRLNEDVNLGNALRGLIEAAQHHQDQATLGSAMRQLAELEPDNPSHRERLRELGLGPIGPSIAQRDNAPAMPLMPGLGGRADFQFGEAPMTPPGVPDLNAFAFGGTDASPALPTPDFGGLPNGGGFGGFEPSGPAPGFGGFEPSAPAAGFGGFEPTSPAGGFGGFPPVAPGGGGFGTPDPFAPAPPTSPDVQKWLLDADRFASRGYADRAVEILEEAVRQFPESLDLHLKLRELFLVGGFSERAADHCLALARLYDEAGNLHQSQAFLAEALSLNPTIDARDFGAVGAYAVPPPPSPSDAIEIDISGGFDGGISGSFGPPRESPAALPVQPPANPFQIEQPGMDFYSGGPHITASIPTGVVETPSFDISRQSPPPDFPPVDTETGFAPPEEAQFTESLQEELEGVDFYISQGFTDLAADTLNRLTETYPNHPEVMKRFAELGLSTPAANPVQSLPAGPSVPPVPEATFTEPAPAPSTLDSILDNLAEELGDFESTLKISGAYEQAAPEPSRELFSGLEESGLQDIFDEFKQSIEQEEDRPDFETHYNLGLAYKDMELLDEAIEEFQTAIRGTDSGAPDGRYFQSCNMLGLCFLAKGMPQPAAVWFKRGLDTPGRSEDEYQAMRYDLASAHEEQGKLAQALELFETVYALDINYRDVGEKIRNVQEKMKR